MVLMRINGIDMPEPTYGGYNVSVSDLDSENTTRSETGLLHRNRIRAGMYKLSCKWRLNTADLEKLMKAVSAEKFKVTFYFGGEYKTCDMYAGDKAMNLCTKGWWDFSCNFIEF